MATPWHPLATPVHDLARPRPVDPAGRIGPTKGQARGTGWRRTSPGLYVPASVDPGIVEQRIIEAAARVPAGGAITGWAALRLAGAAYFDGRGAHLPLPVPIVVPRGRNVRPQPGTRVIRGRIEAAHILRIHDVPCLEPRRALVDAVRWTDDFRERVVAIDMTLAARLVDLGDFRAYLAGLRSLPRARLGPCRHSAGRPAQPVSW